MSPLNKFDDENGWRWYDDGDRHYLSVTTAIDKGSPTPEKRKDYFLKNTKEKVEADLEYAGDFGTKAHLYFESLLKGESINPDSSHLKHVEKFKAWIEDHQVKFTHLEIPLVSKKYGYAGTCDFIGRMSTCHDGACCREPLGEMIVVADWKTSRSYAITAGWQMAAYRQAAIEMGIVDESCGMAGIHIPRTGGRIKSFIYQHYDYCLHKFLCALEMAKGMYFNRLNEKGWPYLAEQSVKVAI